MKGLCVGARVFGGRREMICPMDAVPRSLHLLSTALSAACQGVRVASQSALRRGPRRCLICFLALSPFAAWWLVRWRVEGKEQFSVTGGFRSDGVGVGSILYLWGLTLITDSKSGVDVGFIYHL